MRKLLNETIQQTAASKYKRMSGNVSNSVREIIAAVRSTQVAFTEHNRILLFKTLISHLKKKAKFSHTSVNTFKISNCFIL